MADEETLFEEDQSEETPKARENLFMVDVEGYEGPIDMLLQLARDQKVDLVNISILELADQYLEFVSAARRSNLELAADYLVMAAWLAYLKSRMLLPDIGGGEEPTGEEMAAALQFQLRRLEAMQDAGAKLMAMPRLGQDFYARGEPEKFSTTVNTVLEVSLYDLLKAYGEQRSRGEASTLHIEAFDLYTVDDALERLRSFLGTPTPDWKNLWQFLPESLKGGLVTRSAVASTFTASLELAKEGKVKIRQDGIFGPIFVQAGERNNDAGSVTKQEVSE